jgi:glycosyltransferase involved in cell wall biosynthesis
MKIIYVTESLGAGVLSIIVSLSNHFASSGHDVTVKFTRRYDTPNLEVLMSIFGNEVKLHDYGSGVKGLVSLAADSVKLSFNKSAVIHAHSTIAGVMVRAPKFIGKADNFFYSPHCYAFVRSDIRPLVRHLALFLERTLSRVGTTVAVSESELKRASGLNKRPKVALIENGIELPKCPETRTGGEVLTVVMLGRIAEQKNPLAAAYVAGRLRGRASFVWIGDGKREKFRNQLEKAGVFVTGWLDRDALYDRLSSADVFLHLSKWEAMPVALIEAQCLGLPAIVSAVDGNRDVVSHGETGWVVNSSDEAVHSLEKILLQPEILGEMRKAALSSRSRFEVSGMVEKHRALYLRVAAPIESK